jgi:hypothetical protein
MALLVAAVLLLRAELAGRRPYKRTEVWLMLEKSERPPPAVAQQVIGSALRQVYVRFALRFATGAVALIAMAVVATNLR